MGEIIKRLIRKKRLIPVLEKFVKRRKKQHQKNLPGRVKKK